MTFLERLFARIEWEPNQGCWLWIGARTEDGYARVRVRRGSAAAHRVVWEVVYQQPIPPGLDYAHRESCPRHCVNPEHGHLEPAPDNRFWNRMRERKYA